MTPEEWKRLMEIIERSSAQRKAEEVPMTWKEPQEVLESRKKMMEVQERLEKLLEHNRQKLREFDAFFRQWRRQRRG